MGLKLRAEVGLDGSGFERGLNRLGHAATHNFKSLVVSAFGVYGIHQAIEKTVESAEELVTTSKRLDVTIEQLQVLRQAAKENGVEFGKLATAFEKIDAARDKALGGGAEGQKALAAFGRLGVSKQDLQNQTAAQIFTGPMRNKVGSSSVEDLAGPMKEIFTKGFGELLPVMKTDFVELEENMKHLGSIVSTEAAVKMKLMADEFDLLSNVIVAKLMPAIVALTEWIARKLIELQGAKAGFTKTAEEINQSGIAKKEIGPTTAAAIKLLYQVLPPSVWGAAQEKLTEAIVSGATEAEKVSKAGLDDLQKRMDALVDRSKNPPKPEFTGPETPEKKLKKITERTASDSLVNVGNFLGTARGTIESLQKRQVDLLAQIARNTSRQSRPSFMGDANATFFPIA